MNIMFPALGRAAATVHERRANAPVRRFRFGSRVGALQEQRVSYTIQPYLLAVFRCPFACILVVQIAEAGSTIGIITSFFFIARAVAGGLGMLVWRYSLVRGGVTARHKKAASASAMWFD
jgi:hypothetical protein